MKYCLKFESESEAVKVLYKNYPTSFDEDGEISEVQIAPNYRNIDTIGVIYKPTGEMVVTDEGSYPKKEPIEGWHVNVLLCDGEDASVLEEYVVTPETPVRVWA
jgi:hypothetical protein